VNERLVDATPIFSVDLWNNYGRVKNKQLRSNNGVEGWHSAFEVL
jgi:hypothetical protein